MGSGGSKGGQATKGSEVVADVILPGQSQAVKVRGTVAQPKKSTDGAGTGSTSATSSSRPHTASRPQSGRQSKTLLVDSGGAFHKPSAMMSGCDEIRPKSASSAKKGTATVTEVAPNKYTVEYDNQVIDITSSDFSSFLTNAAEMNVTNKENITNPLLEETPGRSFQVQVMEPKSGGPLQIQLQQQGGVTLEDLEDDIEEIIEPLSIIENHEPESKKTERKEQLRQALQVKKTQLSKQEYEQMIANHKQEMEIMELIRTKEKNRHKMSLEEKMTQRKLRKTRMEAEQRHKELLEVEQAVQQTLFQDDAEIDENKRKEIEAEIAKRNAAFERDIQLKKQQLSEAEYQLILAEHKQNMLELARDFERNEARQKQILAEKIAKRKKKRAAWKAEKEMKAKLASDVVTDAVVAIDSGSDNDEMDVIADRIKRLTREIDRRESTFVKEVASKKRELSEEEYQRLVEAHKKEMQRLVQKLSRDKERQSRSLQEKLGARRRRKQKTEGDEAQIAAAEAAEVELQLSRLQRNFEEDMKRKRPHISEEEYQRLLAEHETEVERLGKKLDRNKERQRLALLEKLANRKKRRDMQTTEDEERAKLLAAMKSKEVLSEDQLQLLEGDIRQYKEEYEDDLNKKKPQLSPEEYEQLMAQHKRDMEELDAKLREEKAKMKKSLEDKIAERKGKTKKRGQKSTPEDAELQGIEDEIDDIELEIKRKQEEYEEKMKRRGEFSDEEYARIVAEHEEEMERLRRKLERQKDRQRQKLMEKIAERKRKKKMNATEEEQRARLLAALKNKETLNEEQLQMLHEDIEQYDQDVSKALTKKFDKGDIPQAEFESLMKKHQQNMVELQAKLRQEKSKLNAMLAQEVAAMKGRRIEPSESEESDDEFNVIPETSATETQLWTTPIQSTAMVMMPLLDEYPVRKKKEVYTDPAIFRELDAHAIRVAQTVSLVMEPTFSSMVDTLVAPAQSELEKIRLIFRWITAQNCQEMDLHDAVDDTPLGVLKGIYEHKITWSTLFMRMCRYIGVQCVEIAGCAKMVGYGPGQSISPNDDRYRHTWNAACCDGYWHFVDCNWGVSHIGSASTFDPFRYQYDEHYFLADPEIMIRTHFPNDPPWQLMRSLFTMQDFVDDIFLKPNFFSYGFVPITHDKCVIEAENGDVEIKLGFSKGYIVNCELFNEQGQVAKTVNEIPFTMYIFQQQVAENILSFYIRMPDPGVYYLVFYSKKHFIDGDFNAETATEICRYKINSHRPSSDRYPLPICPLNWWGPIGSEGFNLIPLTHQNAVVICDQGTADIKFSYSGSLQFHCEISAYGAPQGQFMRYHLQGVGESTVSFRFLPPVPGRFGFNLFVILQEGDTRHLIPFCSYLIVCREPQANVTPYPYVSDNTWGACPAFDVFALHTISHSDPVIITKDDDLNLEIGYRQPMGLSYTYMYLYMQNTRDLTSTVFCEPGEGKATFLLFMENPGHYHLMICACDQADPHSSKIPVYNYLIIRE